MKCMEYKGIKLNETMPTQWDGKPRKMLVWAAHHNEPLIRNVIGYNPVLNRWVTVEDSDGWPFCAEIPKDEPNTMPDAVTNAMWRDLMDKTTTIYALRIENAKLSEKIKSLNNDRAEMAEQVSKAVELARKNFDNRSKEMLNNFLIINAEYEKSKKELFPIVKKYIDEYEGEVDEIEDIKEIDDGKLCITYWRTFKNENLMKTVLIDKSKIELACQNKWDELAKMYSKENPWQEGSFVDVNGVIFRKMMNLD